jgi:hypothetical protein
MNTSEILVRGFVDADISALVEILRLNNQYDYPEVEGPDAMRRVADCDAAAFLEAAEIEAITPLDLLERLRIVGETLGAREALAVADCYSMP